MLRVAWKCNLINANYLVFMLFEFDMSFVLIWFGANKTKPKGVGRDIEI